jgi:Flp pilus assembly pilin Flp
MPSVFRREQAQTMAEYALILSLVMLVALVGLTGVSGQIDSLYDAISAALP